MSTRSTIIPQNSPALPSRGHRWRPRVRSVEVAGRSERRRSEPKSLALLVDVVLARYGILPLAADQHAEPAKHRSESRIGQQTLLFPIS